MKRLRTILGGPDSERLRNVIVGLVGLTLFMSLTTIGVQYAFGAFDDTYRLTGRFDAAGQGLAIGSDVKMRGVNVGEVAGIHLKDLDAEVLLDIDQGQEVPTTVRAVVRPKTLFGEKFIDLEPGDGEGEGPYLKDGDVIEDTLGGFELERVLADLYPILEAVEPGELAVVLGTLADAGDGLGEEINRTLVNFQKINEVWAAHDADTRQFLDDFALLADELDARADDLVVGSRHLNVALPELNAHADDLTTVLEQAARLSHDLADVLDANRGFMRKSVTEGGKTLQILFENRAQIAPLVDGLRMYAQLLAEAIRIPLGDGTMLAAVKGVLGGGELCGQGQGDTCFLPPGSPEPPVDPHGGPPSPPTTQPPPPGVTLPPVTLPPVTVPPLTAPTQGQQAIEELLGGMLR